MKSHSSRKNYGILPLTPAVLRGIQLEFAMIESPAPRARFLDFLLADEAVLVVAASRKRREKRALAA